MRRLCLVCACLIFAGSLVSGCSVMRTPGEAESIGAAVGGAVGGPAGAGAGAALMGGIALLWRRQEKAKLERDHNAKCAALEARIQALEARTHG